MSELNQKIMARWMELEADAAYKFIGQIIHDYCALREALAFYANGNHFYSPSDGLKGGKNGYDDPDEIKDRGEVAQEALRKFEELGDE